MGKIVNMFELKGKTVLVTGSTRGIGRAILLGLAKQGATVIMHGRSAGAAAENTLQKCKEIGAGCYAVYADLSKRTAAGEIFGQVQKLGLHVDILILNGSVQYRNKWTLITDEEYDIQMDTNFRSSLKLAQLFVPPMQEKRWGRVITIGSVQEKMPHEEMMVYAAAKLAMRGMMISLAGMLASDGITVNEIAPGTILTDRNTEALSDPEYEEKVRNMIPVKYIGQPEDIVGAAVMVCSEESRYMTGQVIYIDGGKSVY